MAGSLRPATSIELEQKEVHDLNIRASEEMRQGLKDVTEIAYRFELISRN